MKRILRNYVFNFTFVFPIVIITSVCLLISLQSCKSPTEPGITSNNYTWQKFTFGGAASSSLEDVAIIDANNIWAVGKIFVYDSTGQVDPNIYNAVHWDGKNWQLLRVQFYTICGQSSKTTYPAKSIFAFSTNDIWITMDGDQIAKMNDTTQMDIQCLPFSFVINKIWAENQNSIYIVGNSGNILYFNGSVWQKLESTTTLDISDIWGYQGIFNLKDVVLYAAGKQIFQLSGGTSLVSNFNPDRIMRSVWFNFRNIVYAAGDGIFSINGSSWKKEDISDQYATFRIRGTDINNIWATGGFGFTAHYKGAGWTTINEAALSSGNYESLDVKENIVALVGFEGNSAIITIGTKK